jgi:hypothetical protein
VGGASGVGEPLRYGFWGEDLPTMAATLGGALADTSQWEYRHIVGRSVSTTLLRVAWRSRRLLEPPEAFAGRQATYWTHLRTPAPILAGLSQ